MEQLMIALMVAGWIVTGIVSPLLVSFIKKRLKDRKNKDEWRYMGDSRAIFG